MFCQDVAVVKGGQQPRRERVAHSGCRIEPVDRCDHRGGADRFHGAVPVALHVARQEEDSVAAAQHRLAVEAVRQAEARAEVVPVRGLLRGGIALPDPAEGALQVRESGSGTHRADHVGVEVRQAVVLLLISDPDIPAHADVDGQALGDAPVVLHVKRVVAALRRDRIDHVDAAAGCIAEQQRGHPESAGGRGLRRNRSLRKQAAEGEGAGGRGVLAFVEMQEPDVASDLQRVLSSLVRHAAENRPDVARLKLCEGIAAVAAGHRIARAENRKLRGHLRYVRRGQVQGR